MPKIQAAAERLRNYWRAESNQSPASRAEDQALLADYGAKAAVLVPQLVAALKAARQTIGLLRNDWQVIGIESELEYIDAAIAAGEGRDANRS